MSTSQTSILIATSNSDLYLFLRSLLPVSQAVAWKAGNAADAESILKKRPTAAVIDYELPGSQTTSFINSIRDSSGNFPIIFCHCSKFSESELWIVQNVFRVNLVVHNLLPLLGSQFPQTNSNLELSPRSLIDVLSGKSESSDSYSPNPETDPHSVIQIYDFEELANLQIDVLSEEDKTDAAISAVIDSYLLQLPEILRLLKEQILKAVLRNDIELLEQGGRVCHQICGTAGSFGLMGISNLAHSIEGKIERLVLHRLGPHNEAAATDDLRAIVQLVFKLTELTDRVIRNQGLSSEQRQVEPGDVGTG